MSTISAKLEELMRERWQASIPKRYRPARYVTKATGKIERVAGYSVDGGAIIAALPSEREVARFMKSLKRAA